MSFRHGDDSDKTDLQFLRILVPNIYIAAKHTYFTQTTAWSSTCIKCPTANKDATVTKNTIQQMKNIPAFFQDQFSPLYLAARSPKAKFTPNRIIMPSMKSRIGLNSVMNAPTTINAILLMSFM